MSNPKSTNCKLRIIFEEDDTATFCPHGTELDTYQVFWDNETQSELWRGTGEEAMLMDNKDSNCQEGGFGIFGGGAYCMYTCLSNWNECK